MTGAEALRVGAASAQGPLSPAFRIRALLSARELARYGIEMASLPLFETDAIDSRFRSARPLERGRLLREARRSLRRRLAVEPFQVALIQRHVDLLPGLGLERAVMDRRRVVLDIDDAVWHTSSPAAGGSRLAWLKGSARKIRWIARRADHVVAGNELLADWLGQYAERVTVVPSLVELRGVPIRQHRAGAPIVLGWIGSASTARYLPRLTAALSALHGAAPELRFELHTVGAPRPDLPGLDVRSRPWSENAERDLLSRMDIGVMPLPDTPWTRGKCAYKALQYMAAGVPVVADDVGITAEVIGNHVAGLISNGDRQWTEALMTLARDPELRRRMGVEGRRRVEEGYSVERWTPTLAAILRGDTG
jgi:glycosyltransferase involved in cell wall biosynthesis